MFKNLKKSNKSIKKNINYEKEYNGYIIRYGLLAATISNEGYEWYAPIYELSDSLQEKLKNKYTNIYVSFNVDKTLSFGKTLKGDRYYASNIIEFPYKYLNNYSSIVDHIII
jgi:hypothetical protein